MDRSNLVVTVVLVASLGWTSPARAVDFFWAPLVIGGPSGNFQTSQNWTYTPPPFPLDPAPGGANDTVNFNLGRTPQNRYTVTNVHGENDQLLVHNDSLRLEFNGEYELLNVDDGSFIVGVADGDAADVILAGDGDSTLETWNAFIGGWTFGGDGSAGTVTVDNLQWNTGLLDVGRSGTGTLSIEAGSTVSSNFPSFIGQSSTGTGTVAVTGPGSTWTGLSQLSVGGSGTGFLQVAAGGSVVNSLGTIAFNMGSVGTVFVEGADSTWTNLEDLRIGFDGDGGLSITAGGSVSNAGGIIGANSGSIGQVDVGGEGTNWTNNSMLQVGESGEGTLIISGGGSVSSEPEDIGTIAGLVGRQANAIGTVTVTGADSSWANNGGLGVGVFGSGTLNIQNGAAVTAGGSATLGARTDSSGTATVTSAGSTWTVSGNLNVGGDFGATGGEGTLSIQGGGAVTSGDGFIANISGSTGTVTVDGEGSMWDIGGDLTVGNVGTAALSVQNGGTVTVGSDGAGDLSGNAASQVTLDSGGVFDVRGTIDMNGGAFNFLGGTLHVETFEDNLTNPAGGTVAPGTSGPSAGSTTIVGNYTQQTGATLQIEIGGVLPATLDRLLVEGNAMLGGTLDVSLIDDFQPLLGNTFTILETNFGILAGQFNSEILPIFDGLTFDVIYNTKSVVLEVVEAGLPGDYNQNGTVDAADYTVWRDNLGSATSLPNDDTPGVGQDDYDRWKTNFGNIAGAGSIASGSTGENVASVPEPATLLIWLIALPHVFAICGRNRR